MVLRVVLLLGPMPASEIEARTLLEPPVVRAALSRLAELGLVNGSFAVPEEWRDRANAVLG